MPALDLEVLRRRPIFISEQARLAIMERYRHERDQALRLERIRGLGHSVRFAGCSADDEVDRG